MSFRKRGEVLSGNGSPLGGGMPGAMARTGGMRRSLPNRGGIPTGNPGAVAAGRPGTVPGRRPGSVGGLGDRMKKLQVKSGGDSVVEEPAGAPSEDLTQKTLHPGVRPSPVSANMVTSTGCFDLDKLLTHMGLPLGHSLLVEEQSTTDFQSILAKVFAAQGVLNNRVKADESNHYSKNGNTHVIVLSMNQFFAKELPGTYKGSRKEIKKSKIKEEESKLSVQNLKESSGSSTSSTTQSQPTRYKDLKIAWKYKYADEAAGNTNRERDGEPVSEEYKDYINQFDITSRLLPAPSTAELTFISPGQPIHTTLTQLENTINRHRDKLVRIVVPSFLHPAMYPPSMFQLSNCVGLLHGLKSIIKKHPTQCTLLMTVSTATLSPLLETQLESLFDGIVELEPFPQEMLQYLERIYKGQPNKVQHGLVHLKKLPVFSDRGEMHHIRAEYAFKNGKKRFEIEEWTIPVDDGGESTSREHDHSSTSETSARANDPQRVEAQKQTKQAIDY